MVQFRRDWFNQMDLIHQEMNRLLDHFAGSKPPQVRFSPMVWEPAVDVYETANSIMIVVELAGVQESDINLVVDRDSFIIQGVRGKSIEEGEKRAYHRMEITSGHFKRSQSACCKPASGERQWVWPGVCFVTFEENP